MGHLELTWLGYPLVHHGSAPVKLPTRKALALLIYLSTTGELHPRAKLATLFWPESSEALSRAALRNTLNYLRDAMQDRVDSHFIIKREQLGFAITSSHSLDLTLLHQAIRVLPDRTPQAMHLLQAAVQAYHDDFLAGFTLSDAPEFDNWATVQREHYHHQMVTICAELVNRQSAAGDLDAAQAILARWLELDPHDERVYQRRIQLYLAAGARDEARRTYEACRAMLLAEFGAEPAPATVALTQALAQPTAIASTGRKPVRLPTGLHVPLVGRTREHLQLVELYFQAMEESVQLVIVEGEAGIGKSRFVQSFCTWATDQGARLARASAYSGGQVAYGVIADLWRARLEAENAPEDLVADVWLVELSRLWPELRERYPDLPAPSAGSSGDEATAQLRLFEAVSRLGIALAQNGPLVVFLEDLQWADPASLAVFHYCCRRWVQHKNHLLVLCTVRVEALRTTPEMARWLADLARECPVTHLSLGPLTEQEVYSLTSQLVPPELSSQVITSLPNLINAQPAVSPEVQALAGWLFRESSGQPLLLTELLRALLEHGLVHLEPAADAALQMVVTPGLMIHEKLRNFLPPRVRNVIRTRLEYLSSSAHTMVGAAAVLGQLFTFAQLCELAELGNDVGLQALEELTLRGILQLASVQPSSSLTYTFTHERIRDVAYTELGELRRQLLHDHVLQLYVRANAPAAILAHHALAARHLPDALHYTITAGDEALALFAIRNAIEHYEHARALGPTLSATLRHLYRHLGRAYELDGQMGKAHALYEEWLAFEAQAGDPPSEVSALIRLATATVQSKFDLAAARALLHQAQQLAQMHGDRASWAEAEWYLAQVDVYTWEARAALQHGEQALQVARALIAQGEGDQELVARSLNVLALAHLDLGQWQYTVEAAAEAVLLYQQLGNRAMEVDCLALECNGYVYGGQPQDAIICGRRALMLAEEVDNPWGVANAAFHLAEALLDAGQLGEALMLARRAVEVAQARQLVMLLPYVQTVLGTVHRVLFALTDAMKIHADALATNLLLPTQPFSELIHTELCADYALAGQWELAYYHARQALTARKADSLYVGLTRWYEVEALVQAGEVDAARESIESHKQFVMAPNGVDGSPRFELAQLRAEVVFTLNNHQLDQAIAQLHQARGLAAKMGLANEEWLIQALLSRLHKQQGNDEQTHYWHNQAIAIIQELASSINDATLATAFIAAAHQHVQQLSIINAAK